MRIAALLLPICLTLWLSGCGLGNHFVFNSSEHLIDTPSSVGLNYEEVWFKSHEDETLLHGWFVPNGSTPPLVVFFHGNAANISHRIELVAYLHKLGLSVFIFDYRGYGISDGFPTGERDLYKDALGALNWLQSVGWQKERMIYYGRSLGAAIALQMSLEEPPAAIVLECPFTSLKEIARATTPITYALFGWWALEPQFQNLKKIHLLQRPLMIFHGDKDPTVPIEMSLRLFEKAPEPKTLKVIRGAKHSNAFKAGGGEYRRAWQDFIARSVPAL